MYIQICMALHTSEAIPLIIICRAHSRVSAIKVFDTDMNKTCSDDHIEAPQPPSRCAQQMPIVHESTTLQTCAADADVAIAPS